MKTEFIQVPQYNSAYCSRGFETRALSLRRRVVANRLVAIVVMGLILALSCSAFADNGNFLNVFILTAPAQYIADIPYHQREELILRLSADPTNNYLDYPNGRLSYFSENSYDNIGSSMFWIKLLPREARGQYPLVLIHMAKAFLQDKPPLKNQTFILEGDAHGWRDVTSNFMPKDLDATMAFIPCRTGENIQVANYKGGPRGYMLEQCCSILHWNGHSFDERRIEPTEIDLDD